VHHCIRTKTGSHFERLAYLVFFLAQHHAHAGQSAALAFRQQLSQPQERTEAILDLSAFFHDPFTPENQENAPAYRLHSFREKQSVFTVCLQVSR
jgi:hypothetical protein